MLPLIAASSSAARTVVHELRADLLRRDVHRHRDAQPLALPVRDLCARFAHHPGPDVHDEPRLLEDSDELAGHDQRLASGGCQRRSASQPVMVPLENDTFGW